MFLEPYEAFLVTTRPTFSRAPLDILQQYFHNKTNRTPRPRAHPNMGKRSRAEAVAAASDPEESPRETRKKSKKSSKTESPAVAAEPTPSREEKKARKRKAAGAVSSTEEQGSEEQREPAAAEQKKKKKQHQTDEPVSAPAPESKDKKKSKKRQREPDSDDEPEPASKLQRSDDVSDEEEVEPVESEVGERKKRKNDKKAKAVESSASTDEEGARKRRKAERKRKRKSNEFQLEIRKAKDSEEQRPEVDGEKRIIKKLKKEKKGGKAEAQDVGDKSAASLPTPKPVVVETIVERWHVKELDGGSQRQSKFMRLLGGKKAAVEATGEPSSGGGGARPRMDINQANRELEQQFDTSVRMKFEGGGAKRKGLGA